MSDESKRYAPVKIAADASSALSPNRFTVAAMSGLEARMVEMQRRCEEATRKLAAAALTTPTKSTFGPIDWEPSGLEAWLPTTSPVYGTAVVTTGGFTVTGYGIRPPVAPKPTDPLDVEYDGWPLRVWLERDRNLQTEVGGWCGKMPTAARAAVSAHWSAELRAKVSASAERERRQVRVDLEDE